MFYGTEFAPPGCNLVYSIFTHSEIEFQASDFYPEGHKANLTKIKSSMDSLALLTGCVLE